MSDTILELTADIVTAHVSNNSVAAADVPALIKSVFGALSKTAEPLAVDVPQPEPAVSIRSSVKPDYIVCLEDGKKMKMLKRYLRTNFDMTPEQYRTKWNLPRDYPMVAPNYAEKRRTLAQSIGLGRTKAVETDVPKDRKPSTKLRGVQAAKAAAQAHLGMTSDVSEA